MRLIRIVPLVSLSSSLSQVAAWGLAGHEITATIAQIYLLDSTRNALCPILPGCHLAPVAGWADKIKFRNRWSSPLHYVNGIGDHPGDHCVFGEQGWEGKPGINVLGGIQNTTTWLREGKDGSDEALKFFVHFMGDMHQPLHLTGRNKGGNGDVVHWNGRRTKFHGVWDNFLIAQAVRIVPRNYTKPLPNKHVESMLRGAIYDSFIRQIFSEGLLGEWANELVTWTECPSVPPTMSHPNQHPFGIPPTDDSTVCPYSWAKPIHALNCEIVWPPALDSDHHPPIELNTPEYAGRIEGDKLLWKLLATAGVRMAAVLNAIYGDPAEGRTLHDLN